MTSYVQVGSRTYNGVTAPPYNAISYTWGRFVDPTATAISINGVDWPIPTIQKEHFTAASFKAAIERASKGFNFHCEWIWVDVACIPQKHSKETKEAKEVRDKEIGRQVDIFRHAREVFAWLSQMKISEFAESQPLPSASSLAFQIYEGYSLQDAEAAAKFSDACNNSLSVLETRVGKILSHPWFSSLWTLQEMVLRPTTRILCDDGLLYGLRGIAPEEKRCLNLEDFEYDTTQLEHILTGRGREYLENAEAMLLATNSATYKAACLNIIERLEKMLESRILKGLTTLMIELPHVAYSSAQYRSSTELTDRIYGIVQTYNLSCDPNPAGDNELAKLHALEDEFGTKLVAKSALMSQLFTHSGSDPPRRSWLITQKCAVDSDWIHFNRRGGSRKRIDQLGSMNVLEDTKNIRYLGKAWYLRPFVESTGHKLFQGYSWRNFSGYLGLMLDQHVSRKVFGHAIDYFESQESMIDAVKSLEQYYKGPVRLAQLGSLYDVGSWFGTEAKFVGVVLVCLDYAKEESMWTRIGLMRWDESYKSTEPRTPHLYLPPFHDFECIIT